MKKQILEYSIAAGVCLILGFIICLLEGIFSFTEAFRVYATLCDAFFIPGIFCLGLGIILFVANNGVFEMLAYGVMRFISLFKRNPRNNKYETFYDYHVAMAEKPKADFVFLLIVGGGFILISLLFLLIWANASGQI